MYIHHDSVPIFVFSFFLSFFFFKDTATTEIYTLHIVGSVRCVQETVSTQSTWVNINQCGLSNSWKRKKKRKQRKKKKSRSQYRPNNIINQLRKNMKLYMMIKQRLMILVSWKRKLMLIRSTFRNRKNWLVTLMNQRKKNIFLISMKQEIEQNIEENKQQNKKIEKELTIKESTLVEQKTKLIRLN
eukprot:TRINITY_DN24573_c0_g1_i1.p1 TRINITY_DN24573_c0_g1~~TRINITY_DN24573_c0_g1_i1.p1  ORF type:complete len:186 (-),score=50.75 TRINITY_DN24573_c0_g1_i1:409-966(-)